jgi:hypothetical protein
MQADGVSSSRANRCFTPRRSPTPSSPTVAAKITGRCVRTRAPSIVSARASNRGQPARVVDDARSGQLRAVARHADRRAFGEHRVEMRADQHGRLTRGAGPGRDHVADVVGVHVVQPERLESLRHHAPRACSAPVGAGISESAICVWRTRFIRRREARAGRRQAREQVGRRGGGGHVAGAHALSIACCRPTAQGAA